MTWDGAMTWTENLVYADYNDWRLPSALNQDGSGPCGGYDCAGSEMGHLYYTELGNTGIYGGFTNSGPFVNVQLSAYGYWSSTEWTTLPNYAWFLYFISGEQGANAKANTYYAWAVRDGDVISGPKEVTIDIKPGSDPNSINLSSAGVIPVAILSSDTFDATTVDSETVSLAGARVKLVGKSGKYLCHEEDVNEDGWLDLVCKVYTAEFMIEEGESVAVLEAETYDGTPIRGEDTVRIVPD